MKKIMMAVFLCAAGVYAEEYPGGWSHHSMNSLFGVQYSTRLTESSFAGVPSFNPVRYPLPLDIATVSRMTVDWLARRFEGQPSWLSDPQWFVRSIALENIHDDLWVYKVLCRVGSGEEDAASGEQFCVVVLADGAVVEPVVSEQSDRFFDFTVAPPPLADVENIQSLIALNFKQSPLMQVLAMYSALSGWQVRREPGVNAIITIRPKDRVTTADALKMMEDVLRSQGIVLEKVSDTELMARRWKPPRMEKATEPAGE